MRRRSSSSFSAWRPADAAAHRHEGHHVGPRVEAEARRDPLAHRLEDGVADRLRAVPRDDEEVLVQLGVGAERGARILEREEGELAGVDAPRALDDQRPRRLAVDRGQVDAGRPALATRSASTRPGPDRRQLVGVPDEQDVAVAGGVEERVRELEGEHRRLVHDDQVVVGARAGCRRRAGSRPRSASTASARWIVIASWPVRSRIRRAALPVGAQRRTRLCARRASRRGRAACASCPRRGAP